MRFLISFLLLFSFSFGEVNRSKLVDCYKIFEQRKEEIRAEIEKIEEQRQSFIALKDATMHILKEKEQKIEKRVSELNNTLKKIEEERKRKEELVKRYQQILDEIKKASNSKLVQTYSKMRAGNAAKILQEMDEEGALKILSQLSPKVLSKIFAKMDSVKAAKLSEKLQTYIPKKEE
jgi:flagellar motility protein MotE (MotC chaperone)